MKKSLGKRLASVNSDSFQKAKDYAFLLLKFRLRSEKEIGERLKRKRFNQEAIDKTLAFLKEKRFIDDRYFAQAWIESRLKKPLGLRRIKGELRLKGIGTEIIADQIQGLCKDYSEEDIVIKIAKEKFKRLSGSEPQKAKRRIYAYLLRRGFSPEIVTDAVNQL